MSGKKKPSAKDFRSHLRAPMLLGKKIALLFRNTALKIIKGKNCCGHPNEPGC